jgi:hypothetical protein
VALAAVVAALFVANTFAVPGAARAAEPPGCGWTAPNLDDGGGQTLAAVPLQSGPHSTCNPVGSVKAGTKVWYNCDYINDVGDSWTYVRVANSQNYGWIWDERLNNGGSIYSCW